MLGVTPRRRAVLLAASAALVCAGVALPQADATPDSAPIRLTAGEFLLGSSPADKEIPQARRGGYLVQFDGPIREQWKTAVTGLGAELVDYIPDNAFTVRMTPAQASMARELHGVHHVGRFRDRWKLSPSAAAEVAEGKPSVYRVSADRGVDVGALRDEAARTGAVVSRSGGSLLVAATPKQVEQVAGLDGVAVVDRFRLREKHNEFASGKVMRGEQAYVRGYDGSTQTVAVADTGLGAGTKQTAHADLPADRIVAIRDWPGIDIPHCVKAEPDGPADVDSGHGTHTALSAVGGGAADGTGRGAGHGAKLVFQAVEDWGVTSGSCSLTLDGYLLIGLPDDLTPLFQQAYDDGARVHSNSWGGAAHGEYTKDSRTVDAFMNTHRDMLITFSAGNSGVDRDADGVVDEGSMDAPATAKNVLSVGASENGKATTPCDTTLTYKSPVPVENNHYGRRSCSAMNGLPPIPTWGAYWPEDYPAEPLKSDKQTGNAEQLAPFSSRGPTDDGRIKPDVVAPGSWILSGYSDMYQWPYDRTPDNSLPWNPKSTVFQDDGMGFPLNKDYKYSSGTSMSNPLAAGGAAVVRDYYKKKHGLDASAALVKGTLINTATDLLDENNDGADDNDFPVPNVHEGWGLVNLDKATAGTATFVDEGAGLSLGGVVEHKYTVAAGTPLKVTMAYTDKEASPAAAVALVNDLDLEVVAPNGAVYRGNQFAGGWSRTDGSADRRNNVENVYVRSPAAGVWTVRVRGHNVPAGPQKFALVVDAGLSGGATNTKPALTSPGDQTGALHVPVNLQLRATDADGDQLRYRATGLPEGLTIGAANGLVSGTPEALGSSRATVTVDDGRGGTASVAFTWTVAATAANQLLVNPGFEGGATGWTGATAVIGPATDVPARTGANLARLAGLGTAHTMALEQQVSIPADANAVTASYWVRVTSREGNVVYDTMTLDVVGADGAVLATLGRVSNADAGLSYVRKSYDLTAYKGKTVRLRWTAAEDDTLATTFAVDDAAVEVA